MLEDKQEAKYLDYTAIFWGYTLAGRKVSLIQNKCFGSAFIICGSS
jgi:hypothetical protein